jgi:hypothetical protein
MFSEQLHIVGPARTGNVSDAAVEQVFRGQFGIDVNQYALGSLSLAGMTCDRLAMIEARMRRRIKLDYTVFWAASVHLQTHPSILADALHGPEFTVGQLQVGRGRA